MKKISNPLLMKRRVYLYYIALPLLLLLAGCVREPMGGLLIPEGKVGDSITLTLGLHADDLRELALRSDAINDNEVEKITSLRILVFNEHQEFLYLTDAVLGDPASADALSDDAFLPDGKKGTITKIKHFTATFIQSDKPRYLHFIANYDWSGQKQDYFLVGNSAGAIIPNLTTRIETANGNNPTKAFDPMWAQVRLTQLDGQSLQGKVIKLLRCHAKVTVTNAAPAKDGFELTGFAACNVHRSGTVAPFVMDNYSFVFPYAPTKATIPPDVETILNNEPTHIVPANTEFKIFEHQNDSDKKVFLIIRGNKKLKNGTTAERYYKVDFVAKRTANNAGTDRVLPIIRNNHYKVTITAVNSDGYATMAEAIAAPAHNNIFSSIELQEFTQVSDEMFTLKTDPVQILIVRPGTYNFNTQFAITSSDYRFKPYKGAGTPSGAKYLRYYKRWSDHDAYMGALTPQEISARSGDDDHFSVEVKKIPSDAIAHYTIEVAALRTYDPLHNPGEPGFTPQYTYQKTDGTEPSGATTPLIRNVEITIRKPLLFNTDLVDDPASSKVEDRLLEFDLYSNLPTSVFPFEVLIEAPDLSPRNNGSMENITIVKRGSKIYYRYIVKADSYTRHNGRVSIPMVVNDVSKDFEHTIILSAPYYETETIYPKSSKVLSKLLNFYFKVPGTASTRRVMPSTSQFKEKGSTIPSGVYHLEPTASDGQFKLIYDKTKAPANLNQPLTLESVYQVSSDYGYISFTVRATKTLKEWVTQDQHDFTATSVEIKGVLLHYSNGVYYRRPTTPYAPFWRGYNEATSSYDDISNRVNISATPINQSDIPYPFYVYIPESVFKPTMSFLTVDYTYYNAPVRYDWESLMNTTRIVWYVP